MMSGVNVAKPQTGGRKRSMQDAARDAATGNSRASIIPRREREKAALKANPSVVITRMDAATLRRF